MTEGIRRRHAGNLRVVI